MDEDRYFKCHRCDTQDGTVGPCECCGRQFCLEHCIGPGTPPLECVDFHLCEDCVKEWDPADWGPEGLGLPQRCGAI